MAIASLPAFVKCCALTSWSSVPRQPQQGKSQGKKAGRKKEKEKRNRRGVHEISGYDENDLHSFSPAGDGGVVDVCRKLTPHSILSKPRCGIGWCKGVLYGRVHVDISGFVE